MMTARLHRIAVGVAPIVIGALVVLVQVTTARHIDPWVIGTAVASGALTTFINYVRGSTELPPAVPLNPATLARTTGAPTVMIGSTDAISTALLGNSEPPPSSSTQPPVTP